MGSEMCIRDSNNNIREGEYRGTYTKSRKGSRSPIASTNQFKTSNYTIDNTLTYIAEFGKHSVNATALASIFEEYYEQIGLAVEDLPYKSLWHNLGTGATVTNYGSNLEEYSIASYMGRINYGFDDKYLLTLTCLLYTSPSPRDRTRSRMPSSA